MGKSNAESEPLFSPIKTTDDADDEETAASSAASDGGPLTNYQDDAAQASSPSRRGDEGPETRFRDDPSDNIFDWGEGGSSSGGKDKSKDEDNGGGQEASGDDMYRIEEQDNDFDFSPVSLHDDDSEDEENNSSNNDEKKEKERIRIKANKLINERIYDDIDDDDDDEDERIFVGGGWGRHGSQFSCCPHGICAWCCRGDKPPAYSRGPPKPKSHGLCKMVCVGIAFLVLVVGSGYVGYEAGIPIDDDDADLEKSSEEGDSENVIHHTHPKGEEWLEWLEHEKEDFHLHHWNFTLYNPHHNDESDSNEAKHEIFKKSHFQPRTQAELLKMSEHVFQACSERSLKTDAGRNACLHMCHGHYCCFEKDVAFGSCVAEENSYCFAYAACENLVIDFEMNNANTVVKGSVGQIQNPQDGTLNMLDVKLLQDTCSKENIATLEGIRDCTAFCQHHLCCFNELEEENCAKEHSGECQAYDSCGILVDGPDDVVAGEVVSGPAASSPFPAADELVSKRNFKDDCMQSNFHENLDICKSHCSRYECCYLPERSCYEANYLECDEYYICEDFYIDEEQPPKGNGVAASLGSSSNQAVGTASSGAYDHSETNVNKDIETAVQAVCGLGADHPGDDSWVTACHALCANYLCCFSQEGTESNCRDTYGDDQCDSYQGCIVLHTSSESNSNSNSPGSTLNDQEVMEVNNACVSKARRDPWLNEKCNEACSVRSCCFENGPGDCSSMNQEWCDEFEACGLLYT